MPKIATLLTQKEKSQDNLDVALKELAAQKVELERKISQVRSVLKEVKLEEKEQIFARAIEVIGSRERAMSWLETPVRALADATPLSLLSTAKGRSSVLDLLTRLDYGVL